MLESAWIELDGNESQSDEREVTQLGFNQENRLI